MVEPDTTKTRQRNPTNFVGGIGGRGSGLLLCSLSMNDPPTTLVGFGDEVRGSCSVG